MRRPTLTRGRQRYVSGRRRVLTVLACLALVGGAAAAALGWWVQRTPEDRTPVPYAVGDVVTTGDRVAFAGDLVLYGVVRDERPSLDELGCQVTDGGGPLSTGGAADEDRIVVDGVALLPLVSFPGREGHSFACSGSAAVVAAPLYLVPAATGRPLVPLGAYSLAVLGVPLGAVGLLMLRATRD